MPAQGHYFGKKRNFVDQWCHFGTYLILENWVQYLKKQLPRILELYRGAQAFLNPNY